MKGCVGIVEYVAPIVLPILFCVQNANKINTQVALPVFKKTLLCASSARWVESASMATDFILTFLYEVL